MKSSSQLQHFLSVHKPCLLMHLPSDVVALCSVIAHKLLHQDRISITAAVATHACITRSYAVLCGRHMTLMDGSKRR